MVKSKDDRYSSGDRSGRGGITASAIVAPAVSGSHVLKIEGYSRTKGLGNGNCIVSRTFAVGGHRWYIQYFPDGSGTDAADWISIFICLHDDDTSEVKASYKINLLDQGGNPVPSYCFARSTKTFSRRMPWGCRAFIKRRDLEESAYLRNDVFSVSGCGTQWQSSSAIVARAAQVYGSHILKIDGYSRTKGLGTGKCITSEIFQIGGHRWCMKYYPDGYTGYNNSISISLCLDQAEVNEVRARYKISLLDQDGETVPSPTYNQACYTFSKEHGPQVCYNLISRKDLEESVYLKDDIFSVRCVLAARSSVFRVEPFGPMGEKTTTCVHIKDMEAKVFKAMLHFIYSDSLPHTDDADAIGTAQHLLVAADRYNLERLKLICVQKMCSNMDTSMTVTTLALDEQHGCRGLKEVCDDQYRCQNELRTRRYRRSPTEAGFTLLMTTMKSSCTCP
ncbi:BTB/POZ and MATH domain-containing protein 2-like [Aegilops tauschii subsp. strangulata]|uniref:TD and POZ domain-containing protein 4 n=1 Tax=Aegilops tauschii TaxID=37682 RepID=M8B0K3_AEGTA|nr:BTB/POZ and MATH domain-containing protein 2-like [Triticum aestivum]